MNPRFDISKIDQIDIPAVKMLERETGLSSWSEEDYLKLIQEKNVVCLKVIDTKSQYNDLVGFVVSQMMISDYLPQGENTAEIYNICVSKNLRKQGIGAALIGNLLRKYRKQTVETVWLEVRESNLNAIRFYEKRGFKVTQTRKKYYSRPSESALIMVAKVAI